MMFCQVQCICKLLKFIFAKCRKTLILAANISRFTVCCKRRSLMVTFCNGWLWRNIDCLLLQTLHILYPVNNRNQDIQTLEHPKGQSSECNSQFKVQSAILTGSSVLRYFPNRSTIHACCCGTKLITWHTSGKVECNRRKCTQASLEPGLSILCWNLGLRQKARSSLSLSTHTHTQWWGPWW